MQCETCSLTMISIPDIYNGKFMWATYFFCTHCNQNVCICVTCPRSNIMYTKKNILNHHGYHSRKKVKVCHTIDNEQVKETNLQRNNVSFDYHNDDVTNDLDLLSFDMEESNALNELSATDDYDLFSFDIEETNALNDLDETNEKCNELPTCQLPISTKASKAFITIPYHYNKSVLQQPPTTFFASNELSKSTKAFLASFLQYNLDIAIKILICKASYSTNKIDIQHTLVNSSEDYENFLTRAMMVIGLGSKKRMQLCKMIYLDNRKNKHIQKLPLPSDERSFQQMILRNDTGYSLTRLLPVPNITQGTNRHAFVGLFSLIQHSLLFLQQDNHNEKYTNLIKSVSAQTILDQAKQQINEELHQSTLIALVISWFDDWDKNSSMPKANKTIIFSGVHTIVFVNHKYNLLGFYTNLSCVGLKEANHQHAILTMNNDVLYMQQNYATKKLLCLQNRTFYHVYPTFLYLIADQPAKRGLCGLLGGNSLLHPCFGYSLNVLTLEREFHA